jgi:hypothetical protein
MRASSSSLLASSGMAIGAAATSIAIAAMLLASNFAIINAQPQDVTSESGEIENGATTAFQSTGDSFSIQIPSGWIIQDIDNAGAAQLEEVRQGYGILAQLCPGEQQGAAAGLSTNASGSSSTNTVSSINASRCLGSQEVIHIIRYPDLDTRLSANNNLTTTTTIDNILTYHLQKLQDVGYRSMRIVNTTDMTSNLADPQTNETLTTVPGRLVEMTYSTNFAPDEIKRGYFILTAANETVPNVGTTKGYSVFYEGSNSTTTTTPAEITTAAASLPLPPAIGEVFDSFELIAAPGVAQALAEAADDDDDEDNGADDDDDEDNGADDDDDEDNGADDDDDEDNGADDDDDDGADDDDDEDNGADDDDDEDNGGNGDGGEGEGDEGNNPNEFEDCEVVGGGNAGDVGC